MNRIEFSRSFDNAQMARCDCYQDDAFITVFFAPSDVFPLRSELLIIQHPLFTFHLRNSE